MGFLIVGAAVGRPVGKNTCTADRAGDVGAVPALDAVNGVVVGLRSV